MRFEELEAEWDDDNIEPMARHGIEPEEVEEIVYEDYYPSWVVHGRRTEGTLMVALDAQTLNRLRCIARQKQVGPRHLAAIWIAEQLGREQAATGKQRRTGS
jgi:hypothetical protein